METKAIELNKRQKQLQGKMTELDDENEILMTLVNRLVDDYCSETDDLVNNLNRLMKGIKTGRIKTYSELGLDIKCIELATAMYNMTEGLAMLGSKTDTAMLVKQRRFTEIYATITEGTIPDKTAQANKQLDTELLVEKVCNRAYTVISQKVKSANRLLEAMKKVITAIVVTKEVFRSEYNTYNRIDSGTMPGAEDLIDHDTGELPGEGDVL